MADFANPDTLETLTRKSLAYTARASRENASITTDYSAFFLSQCVDCIVTWCLAVNDTQLEAEILDFTGRQYPSLD